MRLPKIDSPIFDIKLISIDKPVKYRPFTVKEEKILLIAEESKEDTDILTAIKQVINNCCITEIDVNKLPLFDVEYFFLQLRAKSVNNISVLRYKDSKDNKVREFEVDLDKIKLTTNPAHSNVIKITDNITIKFRYPSLEMALKINKISNATNIEYIADCIDKIYEGDEVYEGDNFSMEEKIEFVNGLNTKMFEKIITTFIETMPKLTHKLEYVNSEGEKRTINLEGYRNFFQ